MSGIEVVFTPNAYAFEIPGSGRLLTDADMQAAGAWLSAHGFPYNGKGQVRREHDEVVTIVTSLGGRQILAPGMVLVIFVGVLSVLDKQAFGLFQTGTVPQPRSSGITTQKLPS